MAQLLRVSATEADDLSFTLQNLYGSRKEPTPVNIL